MTTLPVAGARFAPWALLLPLALVLAAPLAAQPDERGEISALRAALVERAEGDYRSFYAYAEQPLWVTREGAIGPAAPALLALLRTARYDGLNPAKFAPDALAATVRAAETDPRPETLAEAELALSRAFAAYVRATGESDEDAMLYEHVLLRPEVPEPAVALMVAASVPSLERYVEDMGWMHPLYGKLRQAMLASSGAGGQIAIDNLRRLRALPAHPAARYVLIDAANATLHMYEGDRPVDSMKVVVGKADKPTPLMAGYIRYAILNPYWNVPEDLVRTTIAAGVLGQGLGYLKSRRYQVMSGWGEDAEMLDPATVDWRAVRRGDVEVRVRQLPGSANAMGKVKYEFPNPLGIYLHDTPDKNLLLEEARQFSNGCVRLEDAGRLGRWLFGSDLTAREGGGPEQRLDLTQPVPVYITYLTAHPQGTQIALGPDPYGRDLPAGGSAALGAR